MKKLRILNRVYDRKTMEFIQRTYTWEVTDDEIEVLNKIFARNSTPKIEGYGYGKKPPISKSPLKDTSRFLMATDFGVIDENEKQVNGIIDF